MSKRQGQVALAVRLRCKVSAAAAYADRVARLVNLSEQKERTERLNGGLACHNDRNRGTIRLRGFSEVRLPDAPICRG
jgi:hypothetical protein